MAQTGYTPILIYSSSTAAAAPSASNLTNSTLGSELAINITDGKLFYKDNANAVQVIGWKVVPTTAGGTGLTSFTANGVFYAGTTTSINQSANLTFDGTTLSANALYVTGTSPNTFIAGANSTATGFAQAAFHIVGKDTFFNASISRITNNATAPQLFFQKARGTFASPTVVSSGDGAGLLLFYGFDGTNAINTASIAVAIDGTPATNDMPGRIVFSTVASGSSTLTERMRISNAGFIGGGITAPAARLHLGGAISAASWTTNGIGFRYAAATYTDTSTAASGTVASSGVHAIAQPTIAATNVTVTYTDAATLYIANSPANGTNVTVTNPWSLWVDNGASRFDGNITYGGLIATQASAPTVASAATITPTTPILFVSGTTQINTITAPAPISANGGQITLIPTGLWTTGTTGNIAIASTAVVSRALIMTYDATTTKWYPSY
jgi:hypothetical protein